MARWKQTGRRTLEQGEQVPAVSATPQWCRDAGQLLGVYEAHLQGYLLRTCDLPALPLVDGLDEARRIVQRFVRACIHPGHSAAKGSKVQLSAAKIFEIDIGNLVLTAWRGAQVARDVQHFIVVKIEPGYRVGRPRESGLLFQVGDPSLGVQYCNPIVLRIAHLVAEDGC